MYLVRLLFVGNDDWEDETFNSFQEVMEYINDFLGLEQWFSKIEIRQLEKEVSEN